MQRLSLCRLMHASFPASLSGGVRGVGGVGGWAGLGRGVGWGGSPGQRPLHPDAQHWAWVLCFAAPTGSDVYRAHGWPDPCCPWCMQKGSIHCTPMAARGGRGNVAAWSPSLGLGEVCTIKSFTEYPCGTVGCTRGYHLDGVFIAQYK